MFKYCFCYPAIFQQNITEMANSLSYKFTKRTPYFISLSILRKNECPARHCRLFSWHHSYDIAMLRNVLMVLTEGHPGGQSLGSGITPVVGGTACAAGGQHPAAHDGRHILKL